MIAKKLPIVILGHNYNTSLGIIKALGEAGYRCEVGKRIKTKRPRLITPELKSKYVERFVYLKADKESKIVDAIIDAFSEKEVKKILIPSDDFFTEVIDRNLVRLSAYFVTPQVSGKPGAVVSIMDKHYQKKMMNSYGIKCANNTIVELRKSKAIVIPDSVTFPCFVKPLTSAGNSKSLIQKYNTKEELASALNEIAETTKCNMLVEQYIDIEKEFTIPGVAIEKEVYIPAMLEKIKIGAGSHKGVTITGKVVPKVLCADLIEKLKKFILNTGFQGIFDIEILYSHGNYYFNEINLRNGAAGYALTSSGINLPAIYVDALLGKQIPESISHKELIYNLKFVNEKAALEYYLEGYSTVFDFCNTITKADIRFILTWQDIYPCLCFLKLTILSVIKKIIKNIIFK